MVSRERTNLGIPVGIEVQGKDGKSRPWREPFRNSHSVEKEETYLIAACYLIISAFTMMRDSEIQGIKQDPIVTHYGSPAIKSKVIKKSDTPTERFWWIADPVVQAIEVLSRMSTGEWLFPVRRSSVGAREKFPPAISSTVYISRFIERINEKADIWGLEPIYDTVTSQRLRRTTAVIAGNAEDGSIAVALQLKHATTLAVANQLSSAYSSPNPVWEREFNTSRMARTAHQLLEQWESAESGSRSVSGPGREKASNLIKATSEARIPTLSGTVNDKRVVDRLLSLGLGKVRLGTFAHCLGDASVALCLSQAEKDRGDEPKPTLCRPDKCTNAFATKNQFAVLEVERMSLIGTKNKATHEMTRMIIQQRIDEISKILEVDKDDE